MDDAGASVGPVAGERTAFPWRVLLAVVLAFLATRGAMAYAVEHPEIYSVGEHEAADATFDRGNYGVWSERFREDGDLPYRDYALEYPPGAFGAALIPDLLGQPFDYEFRFLLFAVTVDASTSSTATFTSTTGTGSSSSSSATTASVSDSNVSTSDASSSPGVDDGGVSRSSGVGGTLARTGADPGIFLLLGGGLVVAGVLVLRYRPRVA